MPEFVLEFDTRQIRRTFERAIGRNIAKILTELITNSDDSYRRLTSLVEDPAPITIVFERSKKRLSVVDHAEGLTDKEMEERFATYGKESTDRTRGFRTRSLFGKGLRDVLFTQKNGQVKSIKSGLFYNCRFRWKDSTGHERPVVDIKAPSRVTPELRKALRIPENGTLVEFVLRDDVHNPQPEKLATALGSFYMLRMICSSHHREVNLLIVDRKGRIQAERQISYRFPDIEIRDRFHTAIKTDLGTELKLEGEIGVADQELTQGEVGYSEREGGLLVLDEDDAVLDLHLFGFDDDPAARRVCGTVRVTGAGDYIRAKLNQSHPEEVLTETRDGFEKQHPFYRLLRETIYPRLEPVVTKLRELGPTPRVNLSDETRERHQHALDILNRLASEMLGKTARVPVIPAQKRTPPAAGIAFVNTHVAVQTGVVTPTALLINTNVVGADDVIDIASENAEIVIQPPAVRLGDDRGESGVAIKIIRITSERPDITGKVNARWKNVLTSLEVTTTIREVLTPVNGIEFERDEYNVRLGKTRALRLFVDTDKVALGAEIAITSDDSAVKVGREPSVVSKSDLVTARVAECRVDVSGTELKAEVLVSAMHEQYVAGARVSVLKHEKKERGKQGLFKGYRFQPLERKVQTQFVPEGYILINTRDPVNARYFGDDPGKAVEEHAHCQVRLADLVLNECLQIMVAQALDSGRLDRRFPNNPEIDVRNYVDEKKYEIGNDIHNWFVTEA